MVNINPINPNIVPDPIPDRTEKNDANSINVEPVVNYSGVSLRPAKSDIQKTTSKDDRRWQTEDILINIYAILGIVFSAWSTYGSILIENQNDTIRVNSLVYGVCVIIYALLLRRSNFARIIIIICNFILATLAVMVIYVSGIDSVSVILNLVFNTLLVIFFCLPKIKRHFVSMM